jgi:hypothetical protein
LINEVKIEESGVMDDPNGFYDTDENIDVRI